MRVTRRFRWIRIGLLGVGVLAGACSSTPSEIFGRLVVVGFTADPLDPAPGRIAYSGDGGRVWTEEPFVFGEPGERFTEGFVLDGQHAWIIGNQGNVYRTTDGAQHFDRLAVSTTWLDAVYFQDELNGVVAGGNYYGFTTDGGDTWTERELPDVYFDRLVVYGDGRAVGIEGFITPVQGVVWTSLDGGVTWTRALETPAGLRALAEASTTELWALGDDGQSAYSTDGGRTWQAVDRGSGGVVRPGADMTDVYFAGGAGFAVGSEGAVWRFDRGSPPAARWKIGSIGPYQLQGIWAYDERIAVAAGYQQFTDRGVILRTTDGGDTWKEVASHPGVFWHGLLGGLDNP